MDKQYWLWLIMAFGAGSPVISELVRRFGSAREVYGAFAENRALAGRDAAEKAASVTAEDAEELLKRLEDRGMHVVSLNDMYYPKRLRELDNPPCVLFVRGNYRLLSGRLLSTAGSRDITGYTMRAQEWLCGRLCRRYTLVSSLSFGCDELACLCAVKNKRPCIEVLPCGFDHEYPKGSRVLREQIFLNGGCIVSEYLPETKPANPNFRRRARIIGGISKALLIFQAGAQSGALAAAEYAGKVFFLPPHDIFAKQYAGAAIFVRAGARLLFSERDIAEVYDGEYAAEPVKAVRPEARKIAPKTEKPRENKEISCEQFDTELHWNVYRKIAESSLPIVFDNIFAEFSCDISDFNEILLDLELSGYIRPISGGRYEVCTQ